MKTEILVVDPPSYPEFFLRHRAREVFIDLANHAALDRDGFMGLANDFHVLDDGWVQIAPFGDFPHSGPVDAKGKPLFKNGVIQRVDRAAGEAMAKELKGPMAVLRGVARGERPWYRGHHDKDPIKYPDPNSYGWIKELANRDDGVYAKVEWTPAGEELIRNKAFRYHSPYFAASDSGEDDEQGRRIVTPFMVRSVAFTNQPNLPVIPLSNEAEHSVAPDDVAGLVISRYITLGVINEAGRGEWQGYFNESFEDAAWALANAGNSAGAKKGWETRRANAASRSACMPLKAAKVAKTTARKKRRQLDPAKIAAAHKETAESLHRQADALRAAGRPGVASRLDSAASHHEPVALTPKPANPALHAAATAKTTAAEHASKLPAGTTRSEFKNALLAVLRRHGRR